MNEAWQGQQFEPVERTLLKSARLMTSNCTRQAQIEFGEQFGPIRQHSLSQLSEHIRSSEFVADVLAIAMSWAETAQKTVESSRTLGGFK